LKLGAGRSEFFINFIAILITLSIAFVAVIVLIFLLSSQPIDTIYYFFIGPFTNRYYLGNMLNTSIPLIFTGLGIAIAFKSSVFNLGGEGQVYAAALVTTVICLALPTANGYFGGTLALAGAALTGSFLAGLSGYFRMKWGTDELISSYLLSASIIMVVNYFITGPLNDPTNNLLATKLIGSQYFLLKIMPPSKLDIGIFIAIATAVVAFFFMYHTHAGYEMRMCGLNREFSRYGGIDTARYLILPMLISGLLHGLAGGFIVLGTYHKAIKEFSFGMGWNGIAVALIARNNPLAVIPAAFFFAYLDAGAKAAMLHSDVTFEIAAIVQAIIYYLVTAKVIYRFIRYRKRVINA